MITLTDTAAVKVKEPHRGRGQPELALRVAVRPGGCSGFSYEMFFDTDVADDDIQTELRRRQGRRRPGQRPAPQGRHARLQGRPPGRRVRHHEPERRSAPAAAASPSRNDRFLKGDDPAIGGSFRYSVMVSSPVSQTTPMPFTQ